MKVPYFKKRVEKEFSDYLSELEQSVRSATSSARGRANARGLYENVFPLFVLLRGLANSEYARNPARDSVLSELRAGGRKHEFLNALVYFQVHHPFRKEMLTGFQAQTYSGYFSELFSDGLTLLNAHYTCNYRGAFIALRCMLEDLYRHLYYRDHPQEFLALQHGIDENALKLSPQFFREYLPRTDYLSKFRSLSTNFEEKDADDTVTMDLFGVNEDLYKVCSKYVHGSSGTSLNAFRSNADMAFDALRSSEVVTKAQDFAGMSVAFLVAAHLDQFLAFNEYERSMVLEAYTPSRRIAFRKALNI